MSASVDVDMCCIVLGLEGILCIGDVIFCVIFVDMNVA
jgi:hypothetical protein